MLAKIISLGDKIELKKTGANKAELGEEPERTYVSQVYDVISEDELKIAMPIVEGRIIPLPLNARYDLCFYTNGGLYQCRATVTNRYKEDGLYVLEIELTSDLKKFQRRQYFRLECTMDIEYDIFEKEQLLEMLNDPDKMDEFRYGAKKAGVALDISGGGIRFTSKYRHEPGECIVILMEVTRNGQIEKCLLPGTILRSGSVMSRTDIYEHRVEFHNLTQTVRELLIKFIFEEERRIRQRDRS